SPRSSPQQHCAYRYGAYAMLPRQIGYEAPSLPVSGGELQANGFGRVQVLAGTQPVHLAPSRWRGFSALAVVVLAMGAARDDLRDGPDSYVVPDRKLSHFNAGGIEIPDFACLRHRERPPGRDPISDAIASIVVVRSKSEMSVVRIDTEPVSAQ